MGERAVKAPIDDAFRPGFEVSITDEGDFDDLKIDIEERLKELDVIRNLKKAFYQKRALGGSAIMLGVKDYKTLARPLDRKTAKGIEFIKVLEPQMLTPNTTYSNPLDPKFGEPETWLVTPIATTAGTPTPPKSGDAPYRSSYVVHESRLLILNQDKLSVYSNQNLDSSYWGQSILIKLYEVLRDFNISWAAAGIIVTDFSQGVFGIKDLMQLVANNKEALLDRLRAMDYGRSMARSILIDEGNESFERKSTNVSGLPDLLMQISRRLATAIDIPLTVLMRRWREDR